MEQERKIEILGNYGSTLSLIEIGLGSILHSFHFPFAGIFLSLNQGYLLCRLELVKDKSEKWMSYSVSNIAAVLKSLSPAGQKLGPMLSLSMQGLLFNIGTNILGVNPIGLSLGMILLSLWSFIQPLVTYYLFFGEKLFNAAQFIYLKTLPYHHIKPRHLGWFFAGVVLVKLIAGIILVFAAYRSKGSSFQDKFISKSLIKPNPSDLNSHPALLALKDLTRPLFLTSLLLTGIFLFYSQHKYTEIIWYLLRPVAIGFIFYYFSRTLTLDRWLTQLEKGRFSAFAQAARATLIKVRKVI